MLRFVTPLFFSLATLAFAQQPAPAPAPAPVPVPTPIPVKPVLRALPLGGDDDINSKPLPADVHEGGEAVVPAQPAPVLVKPTPPPAPQATPIETVSTPTPIDVKPTGDDAVRLQIFLDQSKFGPGIIDGRPGLFTDLAVQSWNEVHGHPLPDWSGVNTAARKAVPNPFAVALVPEFSKDWVDPTLPAKDRAKQALKKRMSYRSTAEFMAERYHCDIEYLVILNSSKKITNLKPRDSIVVPNVTPFQVEALTETGFKEDPALSQRHAVVDTRINQVRIFEGSPPALIVAEPGTVAVNTVRTNRGLVASFPITPGKPKFIKFGTWELKNMVQLPWWRYDKSLLETGKRSSDAINIPAGPNSPVGVIWCGTSKSGIGMHGTSDPETIGRARSAGCIRLANWDAIRLPTLIRPGATVEIR
jgi:lipoprotein-anchoring transpeptidase ErfK/SrfK